MTVKVQWAGDLNFVGKSENGHVVNMSGSASADSFLGTRGPSPMEMLLMGLGGCSGIDVVLILQKMRQEVTDCTVEIDGTRRDEEPRYYEHIKAVYTVTGANLDEAKVRRAVDLSAEKYCGASVTLEALAKIEREVIIIDTSKSA